MSLTEFSTSTSKNSSSGPGGCADELLRVCLDDCELLQLLFLAAEDLARGNAPPAAKPFMTAAMTALSKKDGNCRRDFLPPIGCGDIGEAIHERG